jgi:hypothetical protein
LTNGGWDANALNDQDLDGMATWKEYLAGTSPTNPAERLCITQLCWTGADGGPVIIVWDTVTGRYYSVVTCTNLATGWSSVPESAYTNLSGTGLPATYTNSSSTNGPRFLRIRVRKP